MQKPILALFSPNENRYTETFVQAHRHLLNADVRYLYGGWRPQFSETRGPLVGQYFWSRTLRLIEKHLFPATHFSTHEKAIVRFLKEEKVEVALAEFGVTGAKVYRACREAGVPLIVHFHGFDAFMDVTLKEYGSIYRDMFSYASFIVGVSRQMCAQLEDLGAPKEKIVHTACGPATAFFEIQPTFSERAFIAVGRFVPKKAQYISIQAFARVVERFPDMRLRLGGEGPLMESCQNLAQELGIADKVEFAGPIPHERVREWFQHALALVQHSVTAPGGDSEGTPVAVMEASAAGLPVIATRHAGIPDVVVEGKTGLLVDEHDVDGFADAMMQIAGNEALARQLGAAGKAFIAQNFSIERHIAILDDLVRRAV